MSGFSLEDYVFAAKYTPSPDHPSPREENNDDGYWELGDRPTTQHPLVGGRPISKHPLANPIAIVVTADS